MRVEVVEVWFDGIGHRLKLKFSDPPRSKRELLQGLLHYVVVATDGVVSVHNYDLAETRISEEYGYIERIIYIGPWKLVHRVDAYDDGTAEASVWIEKACG